MKKPFRFNKFAGVLTVCLAFVLTGNILFAAQSAEVLQEIVVKEGETLWGIANYYLKDPNRWPDILKLNNMSEEKAKNLKVGQEIRVK